METRMKKPAPIAPPLSKATPDLQKVASPITVSKEQEKIDAYLDQRKFELEVEELRLQHLREAQEAALLEREQRLLVREKQLMQEDDRLQAWEHDLIQRENTLEEFQQNLTPTQVKPIRLLLPMYPAESKEQMQPNFLIPSVRNNSLFPNQKCTIAIEITAKCPPFYFKKEKIRDYFMKIPGIQSDSLTISSFNFNNCICLHFSWKNKSNNQCYSDHFSTNGVTELFEKNHLTPNFNLILKTKKFHDLITLAHSHLLVTAEKLQKL